jgi:hypothetical protein
MQLTKGGGPYLTDIVKKVLAREILPAKLVMEGTSKAGELIDSLLHEHKGEENANILTSTEFLRRAREEVDKCLQAGYRIYRMGVLLPVGAMGFVEGLSFPDLDISLIGIGSHRFFFFHSALGLVILRKLYNTWINSKDSSRRPVRIVEKLAGTLLGGCALGVGIHLLIDVFQPKSVVFPFFGSLFDGTLIDDNIWLLGNSLWAFRISHDVFAVVLADEFRTAKSYLSQKFGRNFVLPGNIPLGRR